MGDKLPFMPFYGADFYDDEAVCLMSPEEEAVYLRLLWRQWREGSLPPEAVDLEKLVQGKPGVTPRVLACLPRCDDGRRRNPKLERVRQAHLRIIEKRSEGGKAGRAKQLAKPKSSKPKGGARGKPGDSPDSAQGKPGVGLGNIESESDNNTATWLTPYAVAWEARCGKPPIGRLAKALAPIRQTLGDPEALSRWCRYLDQTEPRYCSPNRFSDTHAAYADPETRDLTDDYGRMVPHRKNAAGDWEPIVSIA